MASENFRISTRRFVEVVTDGSRAILNVSADLDGIMLALAPSEALHIAGMLTRAAQDIHARIDRGDFAKAEV